MLSRSRSAMPTIERPAAHGSERAVLLRNPLREARWLEPAPGRSSAGMIARLSGLVEVVEDGRCLVDVNGVGYLVHASTRTLAALPRPPNAADVLIETQLREDAIMLYGFAEPAEREWFR